jgi:hypothetical protein
MQIDETWGHVAAGDVDYPLRFTGGNVLGHAGDRRAGHGDIHDGVALIRRVDNMAALQKKVVLLSLRLCEQSKEQDSGSHDLLTMSHFGMALPVPGGRAAQNAMLTMMSENAVAATPMCNERLAAS